MKTWKTVLMLLGIALVELPPAHLSAQSSFTAIYDFNGVVQNAGGTTDPTPPPVVTDLTFGSFASTGASANPNAAGRFSFTSQPLGGVANSDDFSQFTGSLNLSVYFEVMLTPLAAIELQLDTIAFAVTRSGTGIRNYAVRSSVDGYAANLPASISTANTNLGVGPANEFRWLSDAAGLASTAQNGSLVTLGLPHASLTGPVSFRFYGWNAEQSGGTFSVDNVQFSGSTRGPVPEPTAATLLTLGLVSLRTFRCRNWRR